MQSHGCESPWYGAAESALMKWRWHPVEVDGEAIKVMFIYRVKFIP